MNAILKLKNTLNKIIEKGYRNKMFYLIFQLPEMERKSIVTSLRKAVILER